MTRTDPRALWARMTPSQRERARQIARLARAPDDFAAWCEGTPPGERGPIRLRRWQRDACRRIEDALRWAVRASGDTEARVVRILQLAAPPQEGKSEIVVRRGASYAAALGLSVAVASYSASLCESHVMAARAILRSEEARAAFPHLAAPVDPAEAMDTQSEFTVPRPGNRLAARVFARGRGGALTGKSPDIIITDDMYADSGDYGSAASQRQVDQFLRTVVFSRLLARGGLWINMGTRWGASDTHAWTLELRAQLEAAGVEVIVEDVAYPVRAVEDDPAGRAPGEYLSAAWDANKEAAARIIYGRHAPAILDCAPGPDGGAVWTVEHFAHRYREAPAALAARASLRWLSVDGAATGGGGDHTVITRWCAIGPVAYWLGQRRGQWDATAFEATLADEIGSHRPHATVIENASSGRPIAQRLMQRFPGIVLFPATGSKLAKWDAAIPAHATGSVRYPDASVVPEVGPMVQRVTMLTGHVATEVDDEADAIAVGVRWWLDRGAGHVDPDALAGLYGAASSPLW